MPAAKLKADEVEAALRQYAGNLASVGRALGATRSAVCMFVNRNEKLKQVAIECRETFVDNVESAIYKEALNGNVAAQIFILKTIGKSRGYVERQEVASMNLNINWDALTDAELEQIAAGENPAVVLANRRAKTLTAAPDTKFG